MKRNLPIIIILSIFFLFNLLTISQYGMTWDEAAQHHLGQANLDYLSGRTDQIKLEREDLIYYGPFFEIINQVIGQSLLNDYQTNYVSAFHFLILLTSFIGLFYLFIFVRRVFNVPIAYFSVIFLLWLPRFIAHSHYNSKDIPVAVFSLITLYYLYLSFKKRKWLYALLAGLFFAFALNTRLNAILVLLIFILPYLIYLIDRLIRKKKKNFIFKDIFFIILFILTSAAIVWATWPALWTNPKLFFESFNYFLHHGWPGTVLYNGQFYPGADLPLSYAPNYLLLTTPLIILLFFFIGLLFLTYFILKKQKLFEHSLILSWFLIPLLIAALLKIVRYDGIRHLIIIMPALSIIAGLGLYYFLKTLGLLFKKKGKYLVIILLLITASWLMYDFFAIFPYGGSYFNQALRIMIPSQIEKRYELEYWGASYRQGINWLNKNASANAIICMPLAEHLIQFYPVRKDLTYICAPNSNYLMFITRYSYLPQDLSEYYNYQNLTPVYTISRYNSDLLYIYNLNE